MRGIRSSGSVGAPPGNWRRYPETGTNPVAKRYGATLRLYLTTYDNPRPDVEVSSIDFVSKMTTAAPFLVAMTVEPEPEL